jgi:uncharacterized protein
VLDEEDAQRDFRKGAQEFNAGKFFECHDTLEEIWRGTRGPARHFLQGLIHIAVGFYHLGNDNRSGGISQLEKGMARLEPYGPEYQGIDLAALRTGVTAWLQKAVSGSDLRARVEDLPKIRDAAAI